MNVFALGAHVPVLPPDGEYWIAPNATVIGQVELKSNASVWYGCVLRGDVERIEIGAGSNIQDCSVVHADKGFPTIVGVGVTVGHMAMLHGCQIGDGCLIGIGAVVLNGASIGRNCLIGARALITEGQQVPDNSMVLGAPGKVVRTLTPEQISRFQMGAPGYVANWKRHRAEVRPVG